MVILIDKYIIMNRKTSLIIKIFIFNICILIILFIWAINTFSYQSYFYIHSKVIKFNSYYVIEVLIKEEEVNQIKSNNKLLIGNKEYHYEIIKVDDNIVYQDNNNYFKINLFVSSLDKKYQINNYHLNIKIPTYNKKIINYLVE